MVKAERERAQFIAEQCDLSGPAFKLHALQIRTTLEEHAPARPSDRERLLRAYFALKAL